jgi:predicted phage terminase large subunit-like protein
MQNSKVSLKQINQELARRNIIDFTKYTFPIMDFSWFHESYYSKLNDFAHGKIKKLAIFVPPQHGKSEGATRRLPAFLLGLNPDRKIAIVSYNSPIARKFNRDIQRIIDTPEYLDVFPDTQINTKNITTIAGSWLRNADECEIIGHRGGFKTVGVGGALTGTPVDVLIMDDLYKDAMSAWSPVVRQNIEDWYDSVADTRLHNDSQQLIVYTRWHHEDLAGQLLKKESDWEVCVFPALKIGEPTKIDPRKKGDALWPARHSEEKLIKSRDRNPHVFESLYQQNPKPLEGLLYAPFKTYSTLPDYNQVKNYTDTADTGDDYLCSIDYVEHNNLKYVIDVLYTQKPNEYTEPKQAQQLKDNQVNICKIESNNGGRAYARNVERITKELGNYKTNITWFHQSNNKEARIKSNSSTVNNTIVMPDNWHIRWPEFYNDVTNYMAKGKNKHDDAPDVLTGIVETKKKKAGMY